MSERTFSDPVIVDFMESERTFSDPIIVDFMESERTFSEPVIMESEHTFSNPDNLKRTFSETSQVTSLISKCTLTTESISFDNCELIKLMKEQICADDYNRDNEMLWIYNRIDEISEKLNICIDEPLERNKLVKYLKEMYNLFNEYLNIHHKEAFERHRNDRYSYVLEYHALHEYLKNNGFIKDNVINFINIDKNNRDVFQDLRNQGNFIYFNKFGQNKLKHSDYTSLKSKKYSYTFNEYD